MAPLAAIALNVLPSLPAQAIPAASGAKTVAPAAALANGAWTTYHHDNGHTGYDPSATAAAGASAGWVTGTMDASVYAEPLVYNGIVYAATLGNTVYAFDQATGATVWHTNLRAPETTGWSCGNVAPQGILGTPVIDVVGNRIYAATLGADDVYRLEGLNLATGAPELSTVITTPAPGFDWTIQQERGALTLANGYVYVPFGGRAGDCGPYHGYVFAVPTDGSAVTHYYATPGQGAGFWAAGGVVVDDSTGSVFETSGNGTASGCDTYSDGTPVYENDAIVRFTSTLTRVEAFIPLDWRNNWCLNDQDLGSASMVLISPTLAFQSGKWGTGFLVNPQSLGGLDGQLYPTPRPATYSELDVCRGNHSDANFGSYAYAAPYVYLSCEGNGLVALSVDTSANTFSGCGSTCSSPSWNATGIRPGPPIVAGGAVWAVDTNGGGLYGFNAANGLQIYHSAGFGVTHFTTPSEAGGQIFVGSGNVVRSFNILSGCSTVNLSAAPPTSAAIGTTVVFTAAASGPNCVNPQYEFWLRAATSSSWTLQQAYSTTNTWSWTSTTVGGYYISVHARTGTSGAPFESLSTIPYTITAPICTGVTISPAPPSPSTAGTQVNFTANATGCTNANPLYEFWRRPSNVNSWQMVQAYSTNAVFSWTTTGSSGAYFVSVWAKDASSPTASFDANATAGYSVNPAACSTVGISAAPPSSATAGAQPVFTAAASGCTHASPLYEFWMRPANVNNWTMVQTYSTGNTFTWNSSGASGGYYVSVWAKDLASPTANFDANATTLYTINPASCATAGISAAPLSPSAAGTQVTFTATTSGCSNANPVYEFWMRPSNSNSWTVVQAYSTANTFVWNSPVSPSSYYVSVWVKDAASATPNFDHNATTLYALT